MATAFWFRMSQPVRFIESIWKLRPYLSLNIFLGGHPAGIIYDNEGRLFVNLLGGPVVELDPRNGKVLQPSQKLIGLDGLTFDPSTGHLWAASFDGNCLYVLDRKKLSAGVVTIPIPGTKPDGVACDGNGNVFVATRGDFTFTSIRQPISSYIRWVSVTTWTTLRRCRVTARSGHRTPLPDRCPDTAYRQSRL
jgi:sugar lactone lactonase YvrE